MLRRLLSLALALLFLGAPAPAGAAEEPIEACLAVVQIPSHGISGTIVWTEGPSAQAPQGRTLILTCAHAGGQERRPVVQAPAPEGARPPQRVNARWVGCDRQADLALIGLDVGPMPYVARIAPVHIRPTIALSCGYDSMAGPPQLARTKDGQVQQMGSQGKPGEWQTTHVLGLDREGVLWTHETPWHGRSGGGLLARDTGWLIGVCLGYTIPPSPPGGIYVGLPTIHSFLTSCGCGRALGEVQAPALGHRIIQDGWVRPPLPRAIQAQPNRSNPRAAVAPGCPLPGG